MQFIVHDRYVEMRLQIIEFWDYKFPFNVLHEETMQKYFEWK